MSRSYRTKSSQRVTLTLLSGGRESNGAALSPFGPVRQNLITMPALSIVRAEQDRALTELLNILEKQAEILLLKSCEVLDTLTTGSTHLVEPTLSRESTTTTKEMKC
jgi:hypothetical protein